MSTKGVIINKETPAVGVGVGDFRTSGLIANAVAIASTFDLATVYKINSLRDAEAMGITEAYDKDNALILWHHIKEFYAEVGFDSNVALYIYGVAQTSTMSDMVDAAGTIGKGLINGAQGECFQIAIARNPASGYSATVVDGLLDEVVAAIPKAQALVDWAFSKMFPTRIILEGRNFTPPVSGVQDLRDITNVKAPNVSVVVSQDLGYAAKDSAFANYAAVGTFLGTLAKADVHVNVGWVDEFNLTNAASERWLKAGFSNNEPVEKYQEDWELLDNKGYVFTQTYPRVDGYRWNGDHTCVAIEVDTEGNMNESNQRFGRTIDAVSLSAFGALVGRVKSPQPVNPSNGKLPTVIVADFKAVAESRIDDDLDGKLSGREVIIDKESNLLPPVERLDMAVKCVPMGSTGSIKVNIGLVKQLS